MTNLDYHIVVIDSPRSGRPISLGKKLRVFGSFLSEDVSFDWKIFSIIDWTALYGEWGGRKIVENVPFKKLVVGNGRYLVENAKEL